MSRKRWDVDSISSKCNELGIEFLSKYYDSKENQEFRCSCGNKFVRKFSNVVSNNQIYCLDCSSVRLAKKNRKRALENFKELLEHVENSDFGITILAKFEDYENNKTPLKTLCRCGNIYYPTANSLKRSLNTQCKPCGDKQAGLRLRKPKSEIKDFIESNGYEFLSYEHRDGMHWIEVSCENDKHSPYLVDWGNFSMGNRCPQCNLSKGEERVRLFLEKNNIEFNREVKLNGLVGINNGPLRFDFEVLLDGELYYLEFDGEQHFKPKFGEYEFNRTVKNDIIKNEFCKKNNLNLLRISYTELKNIDIILKEYFKID